MRVRRFFLVSGLLLAMLLACAPLYRHWLSPAWAADALLLHDGKGVKIGVESAARAWGPRMYEPLAESSANFDRFQGWRASEVLLDIVVADNEQRGRSICKLLLESTSKEARIIGYYIAQKSSCLAISTGLIEQTRVDIRQALGERPDATIYTARQSETLLALRVAELSVLSGVTEQVVRILLETKPMAPLLAARACNVLAVVPERSQALLALKRYLARPSPPGEVDCRMALERMGIASTGSQRTRREARVLQDVRSASSSRDHCRVGICVSSHGLGQSAVQEAS